MKSENSSSQIRSVLRGNTSQQNFSAAPPPSQLFSLTHNFIHFLAFVLVIAFALGGNVPAFAADPVQYVNRTADASGKVTETNATCTSYTTVASSSKKWSKGWYVVNSNVTIDSRVTVSGTVNLILCDGATLTVNGGINVASGKSLTIYGQTNDTGTLTIANMDLEVEVPDPDDDEETITELPYEYLAGIGGGDEEAGGTITINGGTINTTGGDSAAGIGGGYGGAGGTITINGGTVNATGGDSGAGIGGGYGGAGGTITINGGQVIATGGDDASGIGGGSGGAGGTITLSYTSDTDSITASSYSGTVTIIDGKTFTDNTNEYSGSVSDLSAIAGKTLTPYMYTLTLGDNITADYDGKVPAGLTVTLTYSLPAGYEAVFSVNDTEIDGSTFTMPSGNVTVTATVTPITYTITYELDGGTLPDGRNNPETYTIESDTFTLPIPTMDGYTFAGWTGEDLTEATQSVTIEKGSTGSRTYTATWKEKGFTPTDPDKPEFAAYSMVLGGTLSVRYYVYLPDAYNSADCTIVFDVSGDTSLNPDPCAPTVSKQSGDVTLYGYDCFINSAQMADEIHATLYYDDNSKTLDAAPYSAEDYLDTVSSNSAAYKDYEVALIEAIRDYGHYVQPMLSKVNGWTIGGKYDYMDSDTAYSEDDISSVKTAVNNYTITRATNNDVAQVLYSLTLGANTTINFYIYVENNYTGSVTVDDGLTLEKLSAKLYRVRFPDIAAHELGEAKSFTVTTDTDSFTVSASALSYVNTVLTLEETDATYNAEIYSDEVNAAVSLYKYYEATINYNDNKGGE